MSKSRRTWILWFLLLATPGSGFLRIDGLPLSSKSEFAVLATSILLLSSKTFRAKSRSILFKEYGAVALWVNTGLVFAILFKFSTFVIAPLGDGFEACYRSIYNPPAESTACESSFENPFINKDNINGTNQLTRMEPKLDFGPTGDWVNGGASHTTWRLPFVNDFPRFSVPWLDRFPFTAKFGALIQAGRESYIPVQFVGETKVTLEGETFAATSYKQPSILLVPVSAGKNKFQLDFKFADLDTPQVPDSPPKTIGPWAQLFVGKPTSLEAAIKNLTLNLRGWSIDSTKNIAPKKYELKADTGLVLATVDSVQREDVSALFNQKNLEMSGFDFSIKKPLAQPGQKLELFAIYPDNRKVLIATLNHNQSDSFDISSVQISQLSEATFDAAWFSIEQTSTQALHAKPQLEVNGLFLLSLQIFDLLIYLLVASMSLLTIGLTALNSKKRLVEIIAFAVSLSAISILIENLGFDWWGYKRALVPLIVCLALTIIFWRSKTIDLFMAITGATIAVSEPTIRFIREFNGLEGANFWGFQVFRGRDSDWLAYQGYAKTVFDTASLQGGEAVFWFQPANRYFIFLQRLIFGENDPILAILLGVAFVTVATLLARNVNSKFSENNAVFLFGAFTLAVLLCMSEQIFQTFAVAPASELVAGVLIMLCFALMLSSDFSTSSAYLVTIFAALTSQFRAEQIFGAIVIFLIVQMNLGRKLQEASLVLRTRLSLVFVFVVCLSFIHNLYYGDSLTFFTGTNQRGNYEISLYELLNFFGDANVRQIVFTKLRMIFTFNFPLSPIEVGFLSLHLIWFVALVEMFRSRTREKSLWLAILFPFSYLIPMLPYEIATYFPRRIIAIQLAFGVSSIYVVSQLRNRSAGRVDYLSGDIGHVGANSVDLPVN